ncbi:hypothetical protein Nmel_015383, partial [Mimus melanotis]
GPSHLWRQRSWKTYLEGNWNPGTCTKATSQPKKTRKRHGLLRAGRNAEPSRKELLPSPELGSPCAHPSDGKQDWQSQPQESVSLQSSAPWNGEF